MKATPKILLFGKVGQVVFFAVMRYDFTDGCRIVWVCFPTQERGNDKRDSIILAAEQGVARGIEKGREEATLAIAKRLLASGLSAEQAAEMAGISVQRLL